MRITRLAMQMFAVLFFIGGFFVFSHHDYFSKDACAKVFKPSGLASCPDGAVADENSCPSGDNSMGYCSRSMDIFIKPRVTENSIPVGSKITVKLFAEPSSCSYVKCLLRDETQNVTVTENIANEIKNGTYKMGFHKLGCSGGTCPPDALKGTISIDAQGVTCSGPSLDLGTIANASSREEFFNFTCTPPATTPIPGVCEEGDKRTSPTCDRCDANGQWQRDYTVGDYNACLCIDSPNDPSCKTPDATPVPQCGADCSASPNVCDNISGCNVCDTNTKTCVPPSSGPQCGADCSANPNVCDNISGCNVCDTNTKTCVPPSGGNPDPSPTGTNPGGPGPQCNDDCSSNPGICQRTTGSCNYCNPSTNTCTTPPGTSSAPPPPGTTSAPQPPTATPTPDFNEAMCKCDSMTVSQIIAGQPAVFTANAKVTGSDTSKAEAKQIEFLLSAGNNPASRKIIAGPQRVNTTSSGTTAEMKYQAQWKITIPQTVEKNVDYVAKATIKCTRKTTAQLYPYTAMVLGDSDNKSILSVIANFFRNLFGADDKAQPEKQDQTAQSQDEFVTIAEKNNLQLGSFAPAKVVENTCSSVKFRFE